MNCPSCGNRNPSTADHCLHCGVPLANKANKGGVFDLESDDPDSFWGGQKPLLIFGGTIATIVIGSMVLFGFDKYDGTCVRSKSEAARYEASSEWERDRSGERRWHERREMRENRNTGNRNYRSSRVYVRCYRKFTGHVDGVLE